MKGGVCYFKSLDVESYAFCNGLLQKLKEVEIMSSQAKTGELKRVLGLWDVLGLSIGQIIGSGIMILTGICIDITGHGTPLAFIVAALMVIPNILALAAIGSAIPATGGMYTYVRDLIGKKTGFFFLSLLFASQLILAMFAMGFAEYTISIIPSLNVSVVAFAILTVCYIANLTGVKSAAAVQKILVGALLSALLLFAIVGLPKVDFSVFTQKGALMPNGFVAFMTGAALLSFATSGAEFISELAGEMKNPGKDLPRAMIIATVVVATFYGFLGVIASGVLPLEQVAGKPLTVVAKSIFPKSLYVFFVIGGGMFALASTLNATFAWCTKGLLVACEDGWLPKRMGAINKKYGTPHFLLTMFYIIGLIPILTGVSTRYIAMLGNGVALIFGLFPTLACLFLIKKRPEAYEKAYFKLPRWAMVVMPVVGMTVFAFGAYLSINDLDKMGWIILVAYCSLVLIYTHIRGKKLESINSNTHLDVAD